MDTRGEAVPDFKYVRNKIGSGFLTGQVEYSQSSERLGSCLATECSIMKSCYFIYLNVDSSPLHAPHIHPTSFVVSVPGLPCYRHVSMHCTERKLKNKSMEGLGTRLASMKI